MFLVLLVTHVPIQTLQANNSVETDIWPLKHTNDNQKVWTIEFSSPLKAKTVKSSNIFIEDELYRLILTDVELSADKKSIIVTPKVSFEDNKVYNLVISNEVTSEKNEKLPKKIIFPFIVNGLDGIGDDQGNNDNGNDQGNSDNGDILDRTAIKNVVINRNEYITSITATSSETVATVTANDTDMHYEGNNVYSLGLTGVEKGDTITIRAYNSDGKRIFMKDYKVN